MMRERQDLHFLFITKRIDRLKECLPSDWGEGYENVTICCTMENQDRVDYRLPIYKAAPIKHKIIICEPLLTEIDFRGELGPWVEQIVVGGESGKKLVYAIMNGYLIFVVNLWKTKSIFGSNKPDIAC